MEILWFLALVIHLIHCRWIPNLPLKITNHPDVEKMANDLFKDIRSKQSVVFTYNETIAEGQALIKALSNKISTYVLDLQKVKNGTDRRLIHLKFFIYPRHSTMYSIVKRSNDMRTFDEMKDFLREIGELSPAVTRPRCLLLLYGRIRGVSSHLYDKSIQAVLDFAWSLKFLDFTIVHFISVQHPMIFYMNPYRNEFVKFQYSKDSTQILFPQKLITTKNYTVKMQLGHVSNGSCIYKNEKDEIEMYVLNNQNWFIYVKQFLEYTKMNVLWDIVRVSPIISPILRTLSVKMLSMNRFPAYTLTYYHSGNRSVAEQIETSRFFEFERFDLFVPSSTTAQFQFPWEIFEAGVSFLGMILTYYISTRIMQLPKRNWNLKRIIFVLLGIPVEIDPQCFVESAVSVSLSLVSLTVTGDLVDSFLGFLKEENLVVYETLEEINRTRMKILVFELYTWDNDNDTTLQELKDKTTVIVGNPAEYAILSEPFIGLAPGIEGAILANLMRKIFPAHPHLFLPSNITVFTAGRVLPLEKNSPWVDTFNMVALRTKEFGLDIWAASVYQSRCMNKEGNWYNYEWESPQRSQNISSLFVLGLHFFGIFLAVIAFVCEINRFHLIKNWQICWRGIRNWIFSKGQNMCGKRIISRISLKISNKNTF